MLARGALGGDERLVLTSLRDGDLGGDVRQPARAIGARRDEIVRPRTDAARVATVAPLNGACVGVLRLELIELRRRRVSLSDRERDRIRPDAEIRERRR